MFSQYNGGIALVENIRNLAYWREVLVHACRQEFVPSALIQKLGGNVAACNPSISVEMAKKSQLYS